MKATITVSIEVDKFLAEYLAALERGGALEQSMAAAMVAAIERCMTALSPSCLSATTLAGADPATSYSYSTATGDDKGEADEAAGAAPRHAETATGVADDDFFRCGDQVRFRADGRTGFIYGVRFADVPRLRRRLYGVRLNGLSGYADDVEGIELELLARR